MSKEMKADVSDVMKHIKSRGFDPANMVPVQKGQVIRQQQKDVTPYQKHEPIEGAIPAMYPMSYMGAEVKEELGAKDPKKADEAFVEGMGAGVFDPELNKLALEHIAEQRGVTVDELLLSKGTKMENAVRSMEEKGNPVVQDPTEARIAELNAEIARLTSIPKEKILGPQTTAEAVRQAAPVQPRGNVLKKLQSTPKDILHPAANNSVLTRIRKKLAIESLKPEVVTVQDMTFTLLPPVGALQPWVLAKVANVAETYGGNEYIMENVLKTVTFSACVVAIDGIPVAEALELVPPGTVKSIYEVEENILELGAQALWEMAAGTSSTGLPSFHPEVIQKVYTAYGKRFKESMFESSIDPSLNRFVCEVEGCQEFFDKESGHTYFCPVHGTGMADLGPLKDLKSHPLA